MRTVAVLPFRAPADDQDANDLAAMVTEDTAAALVIPGVLEARLDPGAAGADFTVGAVVAIEGDELSASLELSGQPGPRERVAIGQVPQLGRLLAQDVLRALGEDASKVLLDPPAPRDAILALARARRKLADEPDTAAEDLLELAAALPAAATALLSAARSAEGTERMPIFYAALERLAEIRPEDPSVLLGAGAYRALHFEEEGAKQLFLTARDRAGDPSTQAEALSRLAELAERAGRADEAIAHLRNAIRLADDARLFERLGLLLLKRDRSDGLKMLARAAVLEPENPAVLLTFARALREHGGEPDRHRAVAIQLARLCEGRPELAEEARAELEHALA